MVDASCSFSLLQSENDDRDRLFLQVFRAASEHSPKIHPVAAWLAWHEPGPVICVQVDWQHAPPGATMPAPAEYRQHAFRLLFRRQFQRLHI